MEDRGIRDAHYDLISALYHLVKGGQSYNQYALDAKHAGDEALAHFFREVQEAQRRLAARAKRLLLERLEQEGLNEGSKDGARGKPQEKGERYVT